MHLKIFTINLVLATLLALVALPRIEANLHSDLREFATLIPRRRIGLIAARHFVLDSEFRTALMFVRSAEFSETWRQVRETAEFFKIVDYVTQSGTIYNDVSNVADSVPSRLRAFKLPATVPVEMVLSRNLGSFLQEAVRALPKAKISNLMARKVQEGGEFATVYTALRKVEFRKLIDSARNSSNLAVPIRTLKRYKINVDDLIDVAFTMLKWGP